MLISPRGDNGGKGGIMGEGEGGGIPSVGGGMLDGMAVDGGLGGSCVDRFIVDVIG